MAIYLYDKIIRKSTRVDQSMESITPQYIPQMQLQPVDPQPRSQPEPRVTTGDALAGLAIARDLEDRVRNLRSAMNRELSLMTH